MSIQRPLPHIILSVTQKLNKHLLFHTNCTFIYFLNIFSEQYTVRLTSFWSPFEISTSLQFHESIILFSQHFPNHWKFNDLMTKVKNAQTLLYKVFCSTVKYVKFVCFLFLDFCQVWTSFSCLIFQHNYRFCILD